MSSQTEEFTYEVCGSNMIVHLPKELDHHNSRNLKRDTEQILDAAFINKIIFDFSNTDFMDSSGIGVLLGRYKKMSVIGGAVAVYGVNARVKRLLTMSGIYKIIREYETKEQAIKG